MLTADLRRSSELLNERIGLGLRRPRGVRSTLEPRRLFLQWAGVTAVVHVTREWEMTLSSFYCQRTCVQDRLANRLVLFYVARPRRTRNASPNPEIFNMKSQCENVLGHFVGWVPFVYIFIAPTIGLISTARVGLPGIDVL